MKPFGAQKGHVVDFLFTLALFCVFAASALMVVVIGANVYRQTVRGMDSNYDSRTSLTYLTEKVRQNDAANAVTIRSVGDSPALVLSQQAGERTFLHFFDRRGLPLSRSRERKLEGAVLRGEVRRVPAGRVGPWRNVSGVSAAYAAEAAMVIRLDRQPITPVAV